MGDVLFGIYFAVLMFVGFVTVFDDPPVKLWDALTLAIIWPFIAAVILACLVDLWWRGRGEKRDG